MLILERKDQATEGLAAIVQLFPINADEHVARLEQDALEYAHYVVDLQDVEELSDRLVVHRR